MDPFEIALLVGAAVVALVCITDRRRIGWIAVGVTNFAITTTYARHAGILPPALFTGLLDAVTVALIYHLGRHKWEMTLAAIFTLMLLTDTIYLTPALNDKLVYVIALELLNWAALVVILGTRLLEIADEQADRVGWRGPLVRAVHRLDVLARAERAHRVGPFSFIKKR